MYITAVFPPDTVLRYPTKNQLPMTREGITFHKEFIMLLQDWFHEDSDDVFVSYYAEIAKFLWDGYNNTDMCHTRTQQLDGGEVGTIPFQSALINGKGRVLPLLFQI